MQNYTQSKCARICCLLQIEMFNQFLYLDVFESDTCLYVSVIVCVIASETNGLKIEMVATE